MSQFYREHYKPNTKDEFYYRFFFKISLKLLDIGCGVGNLLLHASKNSIGIDADKELVKTAKKRGLNVFFYDANKRLPFDNEAFDAVNCRYLIEHLDDPLHLMKEAKRILKKGGKLIVLTDKLSEDFWDGYTHKRPYTMEALRRLAYDSRFKNYKTYYLPLGTPGVNLLYKHKIIGIDTVKNITKLYGKIKKRAIVLEAYK